MEIIRHINDKQITGEVPALKVENEGVARIIVDLQIRLNEACYTKNLQGKS